MSVDPRLMIGARPREVCDKISETMRGRPAKNRMAIEVHYTDGRKIKYPSMSHVPEGGKHYMYAVKKGIYTGIKRGIKKVVTI